MLINKRKGNGKKWMARGFSTALTLFILLLAAVPTGAQPAQQITLLHIGDTHSHLAAWGPKDVNLDGTLGGLPKAAAIVAAERAADPNALFVHAGDVIEGDFFFNEYLGVSDFQLLKLIGLDVMVLGNHEFRFGPNFLAGIFQEAWSEGGIPVLGTNLDIPLTCPLLPWVTKTYIKKIDGLEVGFFGLTNKGAPADLGPIKFVKITYPVVQAMVDSLLGSGAQVVICLSHQGLLSAEGIAANVSGIDVIVNGHDNAILEQPEQIARPGGGTTLIVSAGNFYRYVGRLRLAVAGSEVSMVDYALISADADAPSSSEVLLAVDALKSGIVTRYGDVYHTPLAIAEEEINLDWPAHGAKRDTPLGNLLTDAYRAKTGTDIGFEPFAYVGDPLPAGIVVGADLFRSMSYGNLAPDPLGPDSGKEIADPWKLVTFRMTGYWLKVMLETFLSLPPEIYFPQVSGIRFDYDSSSGTILLDTVRINGRLLLLDQLYSVTVTEGIFTAVKNAFSFLPILDDQKLTVSAFDALRDLATSRGELGLATSNRIRDIRAIPRYGIEARIASVR